MPVIQVFAPAFDDLHDALESLCREVSGALGLQPADVVATHIPVDRCVVPGHPNAQWPVVVLHGSRRPAADMALARQRVSDLVASWPGGDGSGSWVTWQCP